MSKSSQAFRTIREVADWLGVAAHVLRFWESKFSQIKPVKRAGGRRYYRPADMEFVGGIKVLLHDRGLTIRGVQKLIREEGIAAVTALSPPLDEMLDDAEMGEEAAETWTRDAASEGEDAARAVQSPEIEEAEVIPDPVDTGAPETATDPTPEPALASLFPTEAAPEDPPVSEPVSEPESDAPAAIESVVTHLTEQADTAPIEPASPAEADMQEPAIPATPIPTLTMSDGLSRLQTAAALLSGDPVRRASATSALRALRDQMRRDPENPAA